MPSISRLLFRPSLHALRHLAHGRLDRVVTRPVQRRPARGRRDRAAGPVRPHVARLSPHLEAPPVARPYRVLYDRPELPALELVYGARGGPRGARHGVPEDGRVLLRRHGVLRRAEEGVVDERRGRLAAESHVHAGVDHSLH